MLRQGLDPTVLLRCLLLVLSCITHRQKSLNEYIVVVRRDKMGVAVIQCRIEIVLSSAATCSLDVVVGGLCDGENLARVLK